VIAVDADAVASAALACDSVADLSAGSVEEVATYLPGHRVKGIRVRDDVVEVHVVAKWGVPLPDVGRQVQAAVGALVGGRSIVVAIEDVDVPGDERVG